MSKSKNRDTNRPSTPAASPPPPPAPGPTPPPVPRVSSLSLFPRWLASPRVRQATAMRKHVQKLLNHQKDILSPQAVEGLERAIRDTDAVIASNSDKAGLEQQMQGLEKTANKWLKPYPNPGMRENFEVLLVALTVAMGIRTFFLQPFKIPTGSMQPTLFGVTSEPDFSRVANSTDIGEQRKIQKALQVPGGWDRVKEWFQGIS